MSDNKRKVLIIPDRKQMDKCLELAKEYRLGFEFNDFYFPDILDSEEELEKIISEYKRHNLPGIMTVHGAFFDVIPYSMDGRIRKISDMRINQSMDITRRIGAKAVIFHTNYNPCLNTKKYVQDWIEQNAEYWGEILEKNRDIHIYLENMFEISPDILEELSEKLKKYENYGVCLDYAHAFISDVEPEIWARCLGRFVKHIHINDNDKKSDLHLAWGDGLIERDKFYKCYEEYMNGATVLVETSPMDRKIRSLEMLEREGFL